MGEKWSPKNAFWGAVRVYPARPPISAVSKVGDRADSAEGRASTLTACGEVSIPGDELHTWSLCSPPPPAPAAPGPFVHPSFLAPSPFFLLFFLSSPSLLFSSFPSYTHLSLLLLLLSSPPSCPLFIVDLHAAASGLCLPLPLFSLKYPLSFLCLLAIIDIPPPSDPFRSRFLVSQVPTLTPLGNETATTSSLPPSVSRYLVLSTRLHSFPTTIRTVSP